MSTKKIFRWTLALTPENGAHDGPCMSLQRTSFSNESIRERKAGLLDMSPPMRLIRGGRSNPAVATTTGDAFTASVGAVVLLALLAASYCICRATCRTNNERSFRREER